MTPNWLLNNSVDDCFNKVLDKANYDYEFLFNVKYESPSSFFQDAFSKWYTWMDFWTRSAMWNIEAIIATFCFPSKLDLEKYFCEADDMVAEAS